MKGLDYASRSGSDQAACFKQQGFDFVVRYYDQSNGVSDKSLNRAEAEQLSAAGLTIHTVFETTAGAPGYGKDGPLYFTTAQGTSDGQHAVASAQVAGQPQGTPIYFAVDYDASDADLAGSITDYMNAVYAAVAGAFVLGVYGGYRACAFARAHWPGVTHVWQTRAWSLDSRGNVQRVLGADLYQSANDQTVCGVSVDLDEGVAGWSLGLGNDVAITRAQYAAEIEPLVKETIQVMLQQDPVTRAAIAAAGAGASVDAVVKAISAKLAT